MYRIRDAIRNNAKVIDSELNKLLDCREIGNGRLADAMRYSVQNGGKRIRSFLAIEFCHMFNGSKDAALPYACAIEFGHTASLIHDDMPCMDNDDMRRGKPSCHIVYGEHTALLAGDALLSLGFEKIITNPYLNAETNQKAAMEYAHNVGALGMCHGQQMDLDGDCDSLEELYKLYDLKTGLAIKVAAALGCFAANAEYDQELQKKISDYALKIGRAYQMIDDLIDQYGISSRTGKPVGSDKKNNRKTILSFLTREEAELYIDELLGEASNIFDGFPYSALICELPWYLKKRLTAELSGARIGESVLECMEEIDSERRYSFIKDLIGAYEKEDIRNIMKQYGCQPTDEDVRDVQNFLENSKFTKLKRYKDSRKGITFPQIRDRKVKISVKHIENKKIVIVGAGLAGTLCGYFLRQAGANVHILERADINNKNKLCGGMLSPRSIEFLIRIFGEEIKAIICQDIKTVCFYSNSENYCKQNKDGYSTVIRKELDNYVLNKYIAAGGQVTDQVLVNKADPICRVVAGIDLKKKKEVTFDYDILVVADGARSVLRKNLVGEYPETMLVLESSVPELTETFIMAPDEIFPETYGYSWYIPQGKEANIGCGYAKLNKKNCEDISQFDRLDAFAWFAKELGINIETCKIKGAYLPVADIRLTVDDVYFIGDAAGLINTHTGEGICYALASAEILASCILRDVNYEDAMSELLEEIRLIDDSRKEFYDILEILMEK